MNSVPQGFSYINHYWSVCGTCLVATMREILGKKMTTAVFNNTGSPLQEDLYITNTKNKIIIKFLLTPNLHSTLTNFLFASELEERYYTGNRHK